MTKNDNTISNKCPRCEANMDVEITDGGYYLKCPYCGYVELKEKSVNPPKTSESHSNSVSKPQPVDNDTAYAKSANQNALIILAIVIAVIAMFANCVMTYDSMSPRTENQEISDEAEIENKLNYVTSADEISLINWDDYIPQMKDIFMTNEYNENYYDLEHDNPKCNRAVLLVCKDPSKENEFMNRLLIVYSQHYRYYDDGPWGTAYMVFVFDNLIVKNNNIELDLYDCNMETYGGNTISSSSYDDMNSYVQGYYVAQYAAQYHIYELNSNDFEVY